MRVRLRTLWALLHHTVTQTAMYLSIYRRLIIRSDVKRPKTVELRTSDFALAGCGLVLVQEVSAAFSLWWAELTAVSRDHSFWASWKPSWFSRNACMDVCASVWLNIFYHYGTLNTRGACAANYLRASVLGRGHQPSDDSVACLTARVSCNFPCTVLKRRHFTFFFCKKMWNFDVISYEKPIWPIKMKQIRVARLSTCRLSAVCVQAEQCPANCSCEEAATYARDAAGELRSVVCLVCCCCCIQA